MTHRIEIGRKIKEYFSEIGMSQAEAAEKLGVQQAAVSNQLNGRSFGKNSAAKWNAAFGFRINWLMTGEGQMFDPTNRGYDEKIKKGFQTNHGLDQNNGIPVIPSSLFRVPEIDIYQYVMSNPSMDRLPPVPHFQQHDVFASCPGDAMAPRLYRGYLMALRKMPNDSPIINGEIYAVDTRSNGMFVRRLVQNGETLTFIAENKANFPDFELPYSDIISIFRVVGVLIANL